MSNPEIMWPKPFAWNAANKNTIQEERQPTQDEQDATIRDGFPLVTMTPKEAGGIAPNGQDMNGIAYAISSNMVHRQKGLRIQFDPSYAAKIGGYDQGCILASSDYTRDYISLIPNNLTDPNGSGTAGRWAVYSGAGSIASATASIAGIVKIADSLNSDATDTALTANQGKVLSGRTQPATTTNVGIGRFATTAEVTSKSAVLAAVTPANAADIAQTVGIGIGQTWKNLTSSRSVGVAYKNTGIKPIQVLLSSYDYNGAPAMVVYVDNILISVVSGSASFMQSKSISVILPPQQSIRVEGGFQIWAELS